jgi:hypothetical protein
MAQRIRGQIFTFDLHILVIVETMARPLQISYPHAYYHVTCRGNDRRVIFRDDHDVQRSMHHLAMGSRVAQQGA